MKYDLLHIQGQPYVLVPLHDYRGLVSSSQNDELPDDILDAVLAKAREILSKYDVDSQGLAIAEELKHYMDENFRPYWHVVCGRHFGCYSIHE